MPDAEGRIRGIAVPAEAWERIFGQQRPDALEDRVRVALDELSRLSQEFEGEYR